MKKKWYKVISLVLTVAFMTSIFAVIPTANAATTVFDVDKVIECEDTVLGKGAEDTKDKEASGGKYITTAGAREDDPAAVSNPDMVVQFKVPTDGKYAVYAKLIILNGGNDSYHFKFDGGAWETKHPGERVSWVWYKLAESDLKAGEHMFYWNHRETGAKYDCFFITADASKIPTDLAPLDGGATGSAPAASSAPAATPVPSTDYKLEQVKIEGGSVIIEAEDYVVGKTVAETNADGAVGKKAVRMNVDDRVAPAAGTEPGIGFELMADKSDSYVVWARIACVGGGQDSCWTSVNGVAYKDTALGGMSKDAEDYYWQNIGSVTLSANTPGSFGIIPRETGALMDRFIITSNKTYFPSGEGEMPPEAGTDVAKLPEGVYPLPTIVPPAEHPRVLFRASDLDKIRENMKDPENAKAVETFEKMAAEEFDGNLPVTASANYDGRKLSIIEAKAFDYALNGNEENAKQAISAIKNFADTCTYTGIHDYTRPMGHILYTAAEVYDWCYPILTDEDKKEIVAKCQGVAMQMEIGFPPSGQGAVTGHAGEAQLMRDWLSLGIAAYDEYPDIYNFVAGRYLSEFVPARNYWYTSETNHQGSAYGMYRYYWDLWGELLLNRMTGDTVYIPEIAKIPYQWIYTRRPDGQHLREGDDYNENHNNTNAWASTMNTMLAMAANMYKDPILKKHLLRDNNALSSFGYSNNSWTPVTCILVNDPSIDTSANADLTDIPLTKYFGSPLGQMVARTGWNMGINSPDVLAYMRIGEVWAANHHHKDAGNFQIYYKGILASESGYYESYGTDHDSNYNKSSIAHNTFIITSEANPNGVQRVPGGETKNLDTWMAGGVYETGEVIGHEFGPDTYAPEYSYIAGDIAKAYDANVEEALRSMIFLPTGDSEHPAAFVVFDKITTKEKTSKKTFALHMQNEPTVEGNVSVIKNEVYGYNGQLTNQTLLPKDASIEIVGGPEKRFWIDGKNRELQVNGDATALEEGWGRIEISETGQNETDYFLNVMYVGDADKDLPLVEAELIEGSGVTGAKIFDRVAMFNNNKKRTKDAVSFTVPGEGDVKVNVAGLEAGTWSIKANGADIGTQVSSKDGGIIYFTAPAGTIELSYASSDANKTFIEGKAPYNEGVGIKLNANYIYSDVAPTIRDGRTLLPMRAIFEEIGAKVEWDASTATATAVKNETTVKITENQTTAYVNDVATELDVPAMIIDGRFVVPVRFVSEALGAQVTWDEMSSLVKISVAVDIVRKEWDIPNVIRIKSAMQSGDDGSGNSIPNSFDGVIATRWAPEGKDGDAWGIYDLGQVYTLDKIHLSYYNGASRTYFFDIQVSEDGVTYTDVIKGGKSSGTTDQLEEYDMKGVKARYIKYIGGGNTANLWNSLTEIVPIEKK